MMITYRRRSESRPDRTSRSTRARFALESLEERTVLSAIAGVAGMSAAVAEVARPDHHAHAAAATHPKTKAHSPMTITGLVINDVAETGGQLLANATLNGTIKGHAISLPLVIPVSLTPAASTSSTSGSASPTSSPTTQVLDLSLGAVNLSLLGLNVHLGSTCNLGDTQPITVTITANPSGGVLGSLLSGVANSLNGGTSLTGLGSTLDQLESGLTQVLNGVLGGLNSSNTAATGTTMKAPAGQHEVLDLDLNPINLNLLGLTVQTSNICLNVTASTGPGNLLGDILG